MVKRWLLPAAVLVAISGGLAQTLEGGNPPAALDSTKNKSDSTTLLPELRPLDVVRPKLPEAAAKEVAELGTKIKELEKTGLTAETPAAQDAALDEAIKLAERVWAIRLEYQGNTPDTVRWRNAEGEPAEWYEAVAARGKVEHLRRLRGFDLAARTKLASLDGTQTEVKRFLSARKYAEALEVAERQLDIHRHVLGEEHPLTLISMNSIGMILQAQSRLAEAEPFYQQALKGLRRALGNENPNTLSLIGNLGNVLEAQGRLAEAELHYEQALEGFSRVLGEEHPQSLAAIANMGTVLLGRGRFAEAESFFRMALEGHHRVLGEDHPYTLITINNMGILLLSQGRLAEAEPYYWQALEGSRRVLGEEHPDTLAAIANLGTLLWAQGRLAEAESYLRQALEVRRRVLGEEHSDTLAAISNLGGVLKAQGRLAEAELHYEQALEGFSRVLGEEHPDTLIAIANMGTLLWERGCFAEAEPIFRMALEGHHRVLGEDHPYTLITINNMGILLLSQGRFAEAEPLYRVALAIAERLRVEVIGGAQERAAFAGKLDLPGVAAAYALTHIGLDRAPEALSVLERGRARAALDLMAGGTREAERLLRETGDPGALARYDGALASENEAKRAILEAEARMAAAPDDEKAEWRERVKSARVTLSEKTAAVFAELRGMVPAAEPLDASQILAALPAGGALLSFSWTEDGVVALVAKDGNVRGVILAKDRDAAAKISGAVENLRPVIATRPTGPEGPSSEDVIIAARSAVLPEELRRLLEGVTLLTVTTNGPLASVPLEMLLENTPIVYAPSATVAIDRRRAAKERTTPVASAVVVGDPVFAASKRKELDYPKAGALVANVQEGSNAAAAGMRRGDVFVQYGEHELRSPADLGQAIQATSTTLETNGSDAGERPVTAKLWRDGETIEVRLAPGELGVQLDKRSPADGLRSMEFFDRSPYALAADASAVEQVRFYGGSLSRLPATRLEASAVAAMIGDGATLLLGENATVPRVRDLVVNISPHVLHLATHGLLGNAAQPLFSSVALTTPEEPIAGDIGFLTIEEILGTWGGSLRNTDLVVLSACDTASGVQKGDTTMTLPLGFFICGAKTVVASLWKVDDAPTALLMTKFYANLLGFKYNGEELSNAKFELSGKKKMAKAKALQEAKRWLRELKPADVRRIKDEWCTHDQHEARGADNIADQGGMQNAHFVEGNSDEATRSVSKSPSTPADCRESWPDDFTHPYYWAAFVIMGDPGE